MARIRTIKPDFFRHEGLYEAERATKLPLRIAYAGLWTAADREGRFRWRPRALKLDVLPYDDIDFGKVLAALAAHGFVVRYSVDGEEFGAIPSWRDHQAINHREAASTIPTPPSQDPCRIPTTIPEQSDPILPKTPNSDAKTGNAAESETSTRGDASMGVPGHAPGEGEGKGREGVCIVGFASTTRAPTTPTIPPDPIPPDPPPAPILTLLPPPAEPPPVVTLPLADGTQYGVTQAQADEWAKVYPGVEIVPFLLRMREWCDANPTRRKTRRGIRAAIVGWLGREQDRGRSRPPPSDPTPTRPGESRLLAKAREARRGL